MARGGGLADLKIGFNVSARVDYLID